MNQFLTLPPVFNFLKILVWYCSSFVFVVRGYLLVKLKQKINTKKVLGSWGTFPDISSQLSGNLFSTRAIKDSGDMCNIWSDKTGPAVWQHLGLVHEPPYGEAKPSIWISIVFVQRKHCKCIIFCEDISGKVPHLIFCIAEIYFCGNIF